MIVLIGISDLKLNLNIHTYIHTYEHVYSIFVIYLSSFDLNFSIVLGAVKSKQLFLFRSNIYLYL